MERILQRTQSSVDERLAVKEPVDGPGLARVARAALSLAAARGDIRWAQWVISVYARLLQVPPSEVVEHLAQLPVPQRAGCASALSGLVEAVYATGGPRPDDHEAVERMDVLRRMATEASRSGPSQP